MKPSDIVIVGAPRSGTNMLRDVLTSFPGVGTWPCDEINLIWRHGNRSAESDAFSPDLATPAVRNYIRRQFERQRLASGSSVVVEKTCATSLRVGFTHKVLPDAKYVFIVRDGLDAAMSAAERWNAPFDLRYTARKARFVPPSDFPYYAARFVSGRVRKSTARPAEVTSWWGPKPDGYRDLMMNHDLDEVCALQWAACVAASRRDFEGMDAGQVLEVRYEAFVSRPVEELERIMRFLELEGDPADFAASVSSSSVGKGRRTLDAERLSHLETLVRPTLEALGYGV